MLQFSFIVGLVLLASNFCDIKCQHIGASDGKGDIPENEDDDVGNRVAHGSRAGLNQFPWVVRVATAFKFRTTQPEVIVHCGGSLISSRYVLTAAHCIKHQRGTARRIEVILGEYALHTFPRDCVDLPDGLRCIQNIVVPAEDMIIHPDYVRARLENDLALVRLSKTVNVTEFCPIPLPPMDIKDLKNPHIGFTVAGWGLNGTVPTNVLMVASVYQLSNRECQSTYRAMAVPISFCALGRDGGNSCPGDSGGPLMTFMDGKVFLSGIVNGLNSHSCLISVPALYANVYYYIDWINKNIS